MKKTIGARALVERKMLHDYPLEYTPNPVTLTRMVNKWRLNRRPKEPKALTCEISLDYINLPQSFMVADIKIEDNSSGMIAARHLIYATPNQISFLEQASTGLLDRLTPSLQ